jgi:uncharacterized protein (TIGR03663 family)
MMADATRSGHPIDLLRAHAVAVTWIALGLGAALLRLIVLDRQPLSEAEARHAVSVWQALQGRHDGSLAEGGSPLLSYATVLVFGLFGASDVAARLVPALAGVGLTLTPGLLTQIFGLRTTLWAGLMIAISPLAIYAARELDPAILNAALAMLTVVSAIRLTTDRPWWSPWTLALGAGLSLAAGGGAVFAIAAAAVAAVVLFARGGTDRLRLSLFRPDSVNVARDVVGPALLFVGTALLASTGALMDLRGAGFALADVWAQAVGLLAPDAFPTRNFVAILAYSWPLLALALMGYVLVARADRAPRPRERRRRRELVTEAADAIGAEETDGAQQLSRSVVLLMALWALVLLVVAAVAGADQLSLVVLPVAPLALLAGTALARLPLTRSEYELSGEGWTTLAFAAVSVAAAFVFFSQNVAGNRPVAIVAWVALVGCLLLLGMGWRALEPGERVVVVTALAGIGFIVVNTSAVSRSSFGGSPLGTELLAREETAPAFRALFRELTILANADPARVLVVDLPEPFTARWYGRAVAAGTADQRTSGRAFVLRQAPPSSGPGPSDATRELWKVTSEIEPADVYPLGILRWLVSRSTLVAARPHDIIVTR